MSAESKPHSMSPLRVLAAVVDFEKTRQRVNGDTGLSETEIKLAEAALHDLEEQFGTLQEKARRFLIVTGGPPERTEDVGKARRELVDALHASSPAKRPT